MQVDAVMVDLPDVHHRIPDRLAGGGEQAATEVRDRADGRRERVVHHDQVVVGIERQLCRIERALRLSRRQHELFGEDAGCVEQAAAGHREGREEVPTGAGRGEDDHSMPPLTWSQCPLSIKELSDQQKWAAILHYVLPAGVQTRTGGR